MRAERNVPDRVAYQMAIFLLGGVLSAGIDIGLTALLLQTTIAYQTAVSIGFAAGLGINFLYHARVTFKALMSITTAVRFLVVVALNYCIMMMAVWLCHDLFEQSVLLGKVLSLPIIAGNGFLLSRIWVFTSKSKGLHA